MEGALSSGLLAGQAQTPHVPSHPGVILTAQTSALQLRLGGQTSQILKIILKTKKKHILKFLQNL